MAYTASVTDLIIFAVEQDHCVAAELLHLTLGFARTAGDFARLREAALTCCFDEDPALERKRRAVARAAAGKLKQLEARA
ncbi:hypothetical protein L6Q96_01845 [Candidatus Binatia bacterium]|nr:hypothetical protein [Candidatus Binatia bacterium]